MDANGMIKVGPAGPKGGYGKNWDMPSNQITEILIWYGFHIEAIQFQFVKEGRLVLSELHGSNTAANNFISVKINHPSEYIIELSGEWDCPLRGDSAIANLTIFTNLQTYGPIGKPVEKTGQIGFRKYLGQDYNQFQFQIGREHRFGGFHGTVSSDHPAGLRSIGVYLKLPTALDQQKDEKQY